MNEIRSLVERSKKYLRSSRMLFDAGDNESSVSRTYYAMFYCAEAILLSKEMSFSSHGGVISAFGKFFVKTDIFPREMGRELNRAFEKRQLGDYACTFVISREEADQILEKGREFVERVIHYLEENELL